MPDGRPQVFSPFIDSAQTTRWLQEAIGRVENRIATPEQAMRELATEVDRRIRRNLARRADLRRTYERITGRPCDGDRTLGADVPAAREILLPWNYDRTAVAGWFRVTERSI